MRARRFKKVGARGGPDRRICGSAGAGGGAGVSFQIQLISVI